MSEGANTDVDDATQAEMAIKLSDSVRKLIRDELALALEDPHFMWGVPMYALRDTLFQNLTNNMTFANAVTTILRQQVNKL